jgi:ABC-type uncharacterized transport system permease subunit
MTAESALFTLTLFCYLAGSVNYHVHLFTGSERARRFAVASVLLGVLAHTGAIGGWCLAHRGQSLFQDPGMPFSLVAYFLAIVQAAATLRPSWAALGSLSMPLAFVSEFWSGLRRTPPVGEHAAAISSVLLRPHVTVLLLGVTALALAFCLAVIYLVQSRLLKTKKVRGLFSRLPPLDTVSGGAHWLATVGFSMFTLGIITGAMAAPKSWGPHWWLEPHTFMSLISWCIYAAYMGVSLGLGWRGRKTIYFLIAGFLAILPAFFVSVGKPKSSQPPVARTSAISAPSSRATF